ncbi:hypothetical protein P691DRAFT_767888 [Macrolepiota fuliginosa MF-IS2]|uniref:Uncharacterized protein n=1 Tax=Macrolepiota fuliginosa MF-IS2 TaxID=1400762 RepID=A0A9P5WWM1_9AGAR|nr:hypothetical protein P691DRAFT_767888 [Macrolepiota fuliginosa MF-IS2]
MAPQAQAPRPTSSKCTKCPFYMMCSPSHHQFFIEAPTIPPNTSLSTLVTTANRALSQAKSTLKVDSAHLSPCGITYVTATVPSTSDLDIIEATLSAFGQITLIISPPLYQHVLSVISWALQDFEALVVDGHNHTHKHFSPYFIFNTVDLTSPASQSFIKIVDVPYFKISSTDPFTSMEVNAQLQHSIIPSDFVVHWHYICNSPKADSTTIWIDLSDLQQGSCASSLIGCSLFLNGGTVIIKGTKAHTETPQC